MALVTLTFDGSKKRIGLIVRGKLGPDDHLGGLRTLEQHADAILPDGAPVGFYGENNGGSGNGLGLGLQGAVYDYDTMRRERPYYVALKGAITSRVVSTILLVEVTDDQADRFAKAWSAMGLAPGDFNIVGGNCSSHASSAFIQAGLLVGGIPGLDTPDHLYDQIVATVPAARRQSYSGYVGFERKPSEGFVVKIEPFTLSPAANVPNPGTLGSGGKSGSS